MELPAIILNAKVYEQVTDLTGTRALAQACSTAATEAGTTIGLAPPQVLLAALASEPFDGVAIYGQHCDGLTPGSGTGHTTAEAVKATGAVGSLVNHAEHKVGAEAVAATVGRLQQQGLQSLVCADGDAEVQALTPLAPTFVAVEPPELIGGDISVTSADPGIVERNAAAIRDLSATTAALCGAGVKTGKDVAKALELGCHGVLLASGVVKAVDPLAALRDLCSGL